MRRVSDDYTSVSPDERSSRERRKRYYFPRNSDNASPVEHMHHQRRYEREDRSRARSYRGSRKKPHRDRGSHRRYSDRDHSADGQSKAEQGSPSSGRKKALRIVLYKSDNDTDATGDARAVGKEEPAASR